MNDLPLDASLAFIGTGVMAETMITGLLARGVPPASILATHRRANRAAD